MEEMRRKKLLGKWALVTGGSRGIGRSIAIELAKEGANIVINYHSNDKSANQTIDDIKKLGQQSYAVKADVSNRDQVQNMINEIVKNNPIDILINNAGIVEFEPFLKITPESWDRIYRTNLWGGFNVGQLVSREMVKRGKGGKIVYVTSINQEVPSLSQGVYSITKGGLKLLAKVMALELSEHNINVNIIGSGAVPTDINQQQREDFPGMEERYENITPLGRWGKPEDIAHLAVFLSTSPDSDYITGCTIFVDGGVMINNTWFINKVD
jgi:NAD(P)-dependent dehydrogenase (short-subunit alcohol dehydrogenase family)